jgi:hypothetical protein
MFRDDSQRARNWCRSALAWCCSIACGAASIGDGAAATLSEKARESGCVDKPSVVEGSMYRCLTRSGANSYFNVPGASGGDRNGGRKSDKPAAAPAGFPRVDAETQKGRDDLRRKVLTDELAAEEKYMAEARGAYDNGAPQPLPEEKADAEKYRQRISRLREAVRLHERNIEALKKELGAAR